MCPSCNPTLFRSRASARVVSVDKRTAPSSTEFQRVTRERLGLSVRRTQFLEVRGEGRIVGQAVRGTYGAGGERSSTHVVLPGVRAHYRS